MAKKLPKDAAAPKKERKPRKKVTEESAGMGHNLTAIRKAAVPIMERLFSLQDRMESDMGGYKSDFKELYDEGSNSIGCKPSVLKKEFKRALRIKRELAAEAEMESAERDQTENLRAAFEGTPFESLFMGTLAAPVEAKDDFDA